ncbi:MAG: twin-arginine translocase TatA/TatE family subunit [Sphingomonadales bacterium]
MSIGFWQILLVIVLIVLLFGRNKISDLMGDVAKGIKSFKKGLSDDDGQDADKRLTRDAEPTAEAGSGDKKSANN